MVTKKRTKKTSKLLNNFKSGMKKIGKGLSATKKGVSKAYNVSKPYLKAVDSFLAPEAAAGRGMRANAYRRSKYGRPNVQKRRKYGRGCECCGRECGNYRWCKDCYRENGGYKKPMGYTRCERCGASSNGKPLCLNCWRASR